MRKNIFEELEKVKELFLEIDPDFNMDRFSLFLGQLGQYHYKKNALILGKEKQIYNALIENSYNPNTVYKWSLLERVPEDVKYQLTHGFIGQKRASKMNMKRRRDTESSLQIDVRKRGLVLIKEM